MGGGGGPDVPQPSLAERDLIRTQTDLLRQAQGLTEENLRRQDLLSPLLFEQFGVQPIFAEDTDITDLAITQALNPQEGVFARGSIGELMPDTLFTPGAGSPEDRERLFSAAARAGLTRRSSAGPLEFVQEGGGGPRLVPVETAEGIQFIPHDQFEPGAPFPGAPTEAEGPTIGELIGFEEIPDTPEELLRADLERGLLERTQAALSGELPVDPALERSLAEREALLRGTLQRQLGAGFETSTPGMEALSRFTRDAEQLRGSARRADLATAAGLAEGFGTGRERSRALNVAGIQDVLGMRSGNIGQLGQIASALQSPIGQMANQRNLQFQGNLAQAQAQAQQEQSIGQILGMLAGGGAGFLLGGPPGALVGASLVGGGGSLAPSLVRR